jgi:hypothetical protein
MQNVQILHNANLSINLPDNMPVVNYYHDEYGSDVIMEEQSPDKLFVGIDNSIITYKLKPRLLEFYNQLCYLIYSYPNTKLSILKIQALIVYYTNYKPSKDTINKYLNILLKLGLIHRKNHRYSNKPFLEFDSTTKNIYIKPKNKYTLFYITIYKNNTKPGTMALEFYMASKVYNLHHPGLVCKELNISAKTYYKYLRIIVDQKVILRSKLNCRKYYYINKYRQRLLADYQYIRTTRHYKTQDSWKVRNTPSAVSRQWFASPMGQIMKDYGINYIKAFNNYSPYDALAIVQSLFKQHGKSITAPLIVRGILDAYNWVEIVDERHRVQKSCG